MDALREQVAAKKAALDRLRAGAPQGTGNFDHAIDLELTYTSNAIEGNTLTAIETTLVIEQGITIGGKPLKDHLEAIDHHDAVRYIRDLARGPVGPIREFDIRSLHGLVVKRSNPDIAGRYASEGRYILTDTGRHAFPSPAEVPVLMRDFAEWLGAQLDTPDTAFTAHRRLVDIHPFNDGNGRTARLLMNLILIRGRYPPIAIRPEDRLVYLLALQDAQAGKGSGRFEEFLFTRLSESFDDHLAALSQSNTNQNE